MVTLGFLHTAQVHVATFDGLVDDIAGVTGTALHSVQPELLDRVRTEGPTPELIDDVRVALVALIGEGADVVVCTCSTLGPIAEAMETSAPVLRVDRPMARVAISTGERVGVIAALESTLVPTRGLLADEAARSGSAPTVVERCVPEAWAAFEAGDTEGYLDQIAIAARSLADDVDVIVLAQASMAGAVPQLRDLAVPVLASPRLAVEAALAGA